MPSFAEQAVRVAQVYQVAQFPEIGEHRIKHSVAQTPQYYFLREEETAEADDKGSGEMVTAQDPACRSHVLPFKKGGLGEECQ